MKVLKENVSKKVEEKRMDKKMRAYASKKLNETWAGEDVIADLVDRAQSLMDSRDYGDKEDCVRQAIDDGLIYSKDIWDLAEHYGVVDDSELIERYYEELFNDVYSQVEESDEDDEEDMEEKLEESLHVEIDEDTALQMLMDRLVEFAHVSQYDIEYKLYEQMYQNYIDGGVFDGGEFDPMIIVDNDWVNYCDVVAPGDEFYDKVLEAYNEDGLGDISTEDAGYSYIEAVEEDGDRTVFLCRW